MTTPAHLFIPAPRTPGDDAPVRRVRPAPASRAPADAVPTGPMPASPEPGAAPAFPPSPAGAIALLEQGRARLRDAERADRPAERCVYAHLAALRTATAVIVARSWRRVGRRSCTGTAGGVWQQLNEVAPELREWSAHFAAGSVRRAAVEAGGSTITPGEADGSLRHAAEFIGVVERSMPGAAR